MPNGLKMSGRDFRLLRRECFDKAHRCLGLQSRGKKLYTRVKLKASKKESKVLCEHAAFTDVFFF